MSETESGKLTQTGSSSLEKTLRSSEPDKLYPFLNPPQEADEIGRLGHYRIFRLIGVGGMGFVFEAEEISLHRRVAIKVLRHDLANEQENRERFLREARAAAAINSDHVVTIYQIVEGNPPYLIMQYLTGESLQGRIEEPNSITLHAALMVARQTADGLAAAHALGLIHRDIKPANLWLESSPNDEPEINVNRLSEAPRPQLQLGRVKILDFGLARRTSGETSLTSTGFIVGTPNYMSPEQASGVNVDHRSDLFSLGCVLYTLLTGEMPFPGSSTMAILMSLANKVPVSANAKNPSIPKEVADFVDRMLEKNPENRPQSAREVVTQLDKLLANLRGNPSLLLSLPTSTKTPVATPREIETGLNENREPRLQQSSTPSTAAPKHPHATHHRSPLLWITFSLTIILTGVFLFTYFRKPEKSSENESNTSTPAEAEPIVVGVLHSFNGRLAPIEKPVIDSTLLALEELNSQGGVLGRKLKIVVEDGKSDPDEFARAAEKLIKVDKAVVIFGCWTGTSRRTVRPVLERNNGLLFFPGQTEGLEQSPRIVYLGPAPNQYLIPSLDFLVDTLKKKRIILAGSDSIFPRALAQIAMDHLKLKGNRVEFFDQKFLHVASTSTFQFVRDISFAKPDAIINAIYGPANANFFFDLRKDGLTSDKTVTISISLTQTEVRSMNSSALTGDYLAATYFELVDRPEGREFANRMKEKYGRDAIVSDPMCAAYGGVKLWAKTVTQIGLTDPSEVLKAIRGQEFEGPRDRVKIDPDNLHTWLPARIAKIGADGELEMITGPGLNKRIAPIPYPDTRTREKWDEFARGLSFKWEGKWQAP